MASIDLYKHNHIGFIKCPSSFDIICGNSTRKIAIYELLENIPGDEKDFDGKIGDILVGGGRGEAPAFRISMPEAIFFFTEDNWSSFSHYDDLFKAFWTPTQSFELCEGFLKLGWKADHPIEFWLGENVCLLLMNKVEKYAKYRSKTLSISELDFTTEF